MEHRSKAAIGVIFWGLPLVATDFAMHARHDLLLRDRSGTVTISEKGITYQEVSKRKKPESGSWNYADLQQVYLSPERIVVTTYKDRSRWLLGVDKEFEFKLEPKQDVKPVYAFLKTRLDERFVAALSDVEASDKLWEVPVKRLGTLQGSEGILRVGTERIVYETAKQEDSRSWRLRDIDNISTSGPRQLTITSYERAVTHYGSLKGFNFQLKESLNERRFDQLWRRLNRDKGLQYINSIQETKQP